MILVSASVRWIGYLSFTAENFCRTLKFRLWYSVHPLASGPLTRSPLPYGQSLFVYSKLLNILVCSLGLMRGMVCYRVCLQVCMGGVATSSSCSRAAHHARIAIHRFSKVTKLKIFGPKKGLQYRHLHELVKQKHCHKHLTCKCMYIL